MVNEQLRATPGAPLAEAAPKAEATTSGVTNAQGSSAPGSPAVVVTPAVVDVATGSVAATVVSSPTEPALVVEPDPPHETSRRKAAVAEMIRERMVPPSLNRAEPTGST
jgi:hypothetical protein